MIQYDEKQIQDELKAEFFKTIKKVWNLHNFDINEY